MAHGELSHMTPEKGREAARRYEAKIQGPGYLIRKAGFSALADEVIKNAGGVCERCGAPDAGDRKGELHIHHVNGDPKDTVLENLSLLCRQCRVTTYVEMRGGA